MLAPFGQAAGSSLLDWLPILLFLGIALVLSFGFVVLPMIVSRFTGTHKPTPEKLTEYECGFPAFEDTRSQFDVRFYRVALLFIIMDVEAAFLYPWAVSVFDLGWAAWIGMMIFLLILTVGFAYEWAMGVLEWE
ncbi:MAG: NADH-quinone oxidoreductase subunit A [Sphingomonas paucimobilis]